MNPASITARAGHAKFSVLLVWLVTGVFYAPAWLVGQLWWCVAWAGFAIADGFTAGHTFWSRRNGDGPPPG